MNIFHNPFRKISLTVFALSIMFSAANAQFAGGDGSEGDPYQVSNPAELHAMLDTDSSTYFILTADIDMAGDSTWVPLRSAGFNQWYGHIDGDYHVISNLYIFNGDFATVNVGFIGDMGNPSSVVRLGFDNFTVDSFGNRVGGIAATVFQPGRTVEECFITNGTVIGGNHTAGLIAWGWPNGNVIRNNYFDGVVMGAEVVGGILARSRLDSVGYAPDILDEISNNIFYGAVSANPGPVGPVSGDLTGNSVDTWHASMYYHERNTPNAVSLTATALDSNALNVEANYPTLDFGNTWMMGDNYPVLRGFHETTTSPFAGGDGSEANPYQVSNPAELHAMLDTDSSTYFILTADIDMAGDSTWVPLRSAGFNQWYGHIDGDYHVISNLYIFNGDFATVNVGFIGDMGNPSSVVRLGFDNFTVDSFGNRVGGIAATVFQPGRTVEECFITNGTVIGGNHTAGLIAWGWPNGNVIRNNYFDGVVMGAEVVGGILARSRLDSVGYAPDILDEISNNIFYGAVSANPGPVGPVSGDLTGNSVDTWHESMYYHNRNTANAVSATATALDSTALTDWASYPTLDQNIWTMGANYPVLKGFVTAVSVEHSFENIVKDFTLDQNYPNPFNPSTTFKFTLPANEHVVLEVFNLLGKKVDVLVDERLQAGTHRINYVATSLPTGVYLYRITAGEYREIRKMTLVK